LEKEMKAKNTKPKKPSQYKALYDEMCHAKERIRPLEEKVEFLERFLVASFNALHAIHKIDDTLGQVIDEWAKSHGRGSRKDRRKDKLQAQLEVLQAELW
jgi:hypothetical protein